MAASKKIEAMKKADLVKEVMRLKSMLGKRESQLKKQKVEYDKTVKALNDAMDALGEAEKNSPVQATRAITELTVKVKGRDTTIRSLRSLLDKRDQSIAKLEEALDEMRMELAGLKGNSAMDDANGPPECVPKNCWQCDYSEHASDGTGPHVACAHIDVLEAGHGKLVGEPSGIGVATWCPLRKEETKPEPPTCVPDSCHDCDYLDVRQRTDPEICRYKDIDRSIDDSPEDPPVWCPILTELHKKAQEQYDNPKGVPRTCGKCEWDGVRDGNIPICAHPDEESGNAEALVSLALAPPKWCPIRLYLNSKEEKTPHDIEGTVICESCETLVRNEKLLPGGFIEIEDDILCVNCGIKRADSLMHVLNNMKEGEPIFQDDDVVVFLMSRDQNNSQGFLEGSIRGQPWKNVKGEWVYPVCVTLSDYTHSDIMLEVPQNKLGSREG